jgi:hypothetical protein
VKGAPETEWVVMLDEEENPGTGRRMESGFMVYLGLRGT